MTPKTLDIAGLFGAPLIWAFNTQLGQILPAVDCGSRTGFTAVDAFLSAGIAVTCGVLSERGRRSTASRMAMFLMSLASSSRWFFPSHSFFRAQRHCC